MSDITSLLSDQNYIGFQNKVEFFIKVKNGSGLIEAATYQVQFDAFFRYIVPLYPNDPLITAVSSNKVIQILEISNYRPLKV